MHGSDDDGRGNELSQSVRVAGGVIDAERDGDGHWRRTVPSPRGGSGGSAGGSDLRDVVNGKRPRNWPTPGVQGPTSGGWSSKPRPGHQINLSDAVKGVTRPVGPAVASWEPDSLWPTPRASEWKGTGPLGSKSQAHRLDRHYLDATVQEVGQETGPLNPDWVEWLMGFPIGWTDLSVDEPVVLEGDPWPADPSPGIPRMAKGVAHRKQRLMQLGNAVVPKIPEILGLELRELLATVEEEEAP